VTTAAPVATLVQLSDIHMLAEGLLHDVVDPMAHLESALASVASAGVPITALVLSGDITDGGAPEAYARVRDVVEPAARRLGARVIPVMGNHDERGAFRAALLPEDPSVDPLAPCDQVHRLGGLRVVVVDSTTPGVHGGELTDAQLHRLADELAVPAPEGTVLVLHHPPVPSPMPTMREVGLARPDRLAEVIAGTDVRMVLCGHDHHASCGALAGIPVWIGPATSYRADVFPPPGCFRGVTGSAFTRVDLYPDSAVATAVPLGPTAVVHSADAQQATHRLTTCHLADR